MLILIAQKKKFDALNVTQKKPQLSVFASFSWFFQKWYFAESWGSLRCKYPKAEKFCLWISVELSTLISVITQICVDSLLLGCDYKNSALHTYPCHDADKCGQCHTYPEAELFIIWGTYKIPIKATFLFRMLLGTL